MHATDNAISITLFSDSFLLQPLAYGLLNPLGANVCLLENL